MPLTFEQALEFVSGLQHRGWRLGLDRMREFVVRAGLLNSIEGDLAPRFIHVAGTNGKGSTTAYVQSVLMSQGFRVGGYFSPYVYHVTERIQLGGEPISDDEFTRLVEALIPVATSMDESELGPVTEFEFKTAMGFRCWGDAGCDWVALEVGLGGELDATNVIAPDCSVIASIGLDHGEILGPTLQNIAKAKAGILKPGVPAVVGNLPVPAMEVVLKVAQERGCPLWRVGREVVAERDGKGAYAVQTPTRRFSPVVPGMKGPHQIDNAALALAAAEASQAIEDPSAACEALARTRLPGRFEVREFAGKRMVLDGAHNADSARELRSTLDEEFSGLPVVLLVGMLSGHDCAAFFEPLVGRVGRGHAAPIDFFRAMPPLLVAECATRAGVPCSAHSDLESALDQSLQETPEGGVLLVTGSFYLVGEVGRSLREREARHIHASA